MVALSRVVVVALVFLLLVVAALAFFSYLWWLSMAPGTLSVQVVVFSPFHEPFPTRWWCSLLSFSFDHHKNDLPLCVTSEEKSKYTQQTLLLLKGWCSPFRVFL